MSSFKSLTRIAAIGTALAAGLLAMTPEAVFAQSGTWSVSGTTPAAWSGTSKWTGGIVAGGTDSTATFTATNTQTPYLLSNIVLGNLTTGGSRVQIRSGTETTNSLLTNEQIEFATTTGTAPAITNVGRLDMFAIIAGSQGFTKSGAGALYLNRTNTYTGTTTITAGDVRLGVNAGLGDSSTGNGTVVQTGAILRLDVAATSSYQGTSITTNEPFTISGTGVAGTGGGVLRSQSGDNTFAGPITLAADASIGCNSTAANLTLSGAINLGSNNLSLIDGGPFTVSGGFVGTSGTVSFTGSGAITLSGSSSFTGTTRVENSTGLVTMTGYMAGLMDFAPGGARTLAGTGTFAGGLYVGNNATLAPGASAATSDYATITASTLEVQSATVQMGILNDTTYDQLVMTAGSNGLTLGGATASLNLDFASLLTNFTTVDLFDFTGLSGSFLGGVTSTGSYSGTWTESLGVYTLANVGPGGTQTLTFNQATGDVVVVPEPSTTVLLGSIVAVASLIRYRRHRAL